MSGCNHILVCAGSLCVAYLKVCVTWKSVILEWKRERKVKEEKKVAHFVLNIPLKFRICCQSESNRETLLEVVCVCVSVLDDYDD